MDGKYRLYVWDDDSLIVYVPGLIVAAALSVEEARRIILEKTEEWEEEDVKEALSHDPKVYDLPAGIHIWGG